jgi:hypothetical protein
MADYYPVLARAISRLSDNDARKRQEIYDRARTVVLEELRKLDPEKIAPEQAQLEAAILRLEAELSAKDAAVAAAQPPPIAEVDPAPQGKTPSGYFARIFRSPRPPAPPAKPMPTAPAPVRARERKARGRRAQKPPDELGGMLSSLSTMLFGTAFLVAVLAITGVVYLRGLIWVAAGVITYPGLLVVTAAVFGLSLAVAVSIFRAASALSAFGFLSRLIHSASRRVF